MSARSSTLPAFAFLAFRSLANAMRARFRRLQQPRYLVGLAVGLAYFGLLLFKPGRGRRVPARPAGIPPELLALAPLLTATGLLVAAALAVILKRGSSALSLSEGEAHFLFSGPLPRTAVVHFSLLRPQLGLLGASLLFALFSRPGTPAEALRTALGTWIALATTHFLLLAIGFAKAAWNEEPPARRRAKKVAASLAALLVAAAVVGTLVLAFGASAGGAGSRGPSVVAFEGAFLSGPLGRLPFYLLAPFRAVAAPVAAPDGGRFLASLPAALCVLGFLYLWVVRTNVRYEDATLESAARRAQIRARREAGRLEGLPSAARRLRVPFALPPTGRPEAAIVWKNLIAWNRTPLRFTLLGIAGAGALFFAAALLVSRPEADAVAGMMALVILTVTAAVSTTMTVGFRNDLRADLAEAGTLKLWPLPAGRLVLAELAAPWLLSVLIAWSGLFLALAVVAGRALHATFAGGGAGILGGALRLGTLAPAALAAAFFLPALAALVLVVQNGATLAFPSWFPPGTKKTGGLEHLGIRVVTALVTLVLLAVALVPSALLVAPLVLVAWKSLGLWTLPFAGLLAALPLFAEAALGVQILARLWNRFDPSLDLGG